MRELKCDRCGTPISENEERWYMVEQHLPYRNALKRELCRYCSVEIMEFLVGDIKKEIEADERGSDK